MGHSRLKDWFPSMDFVVWNGVMDGVVPYVLIWTLTYGLVHVY